MKEITTKTLAMEIVKDIASKIEPHHPIGFEEGLELIECVEAHLRDAEVTIGAVEYEVDRPMKTTPDETKSGDQMSMVTIRDPLTCEPIGDPIEVPVTRRAWKPTKKQPTPTAAMNAILSGRKQITLQQFTDILRAKHLDAVMPIAQTFNELVACGRLKKTRGSAYRVVPVAEAARRYVRAIPKAQLKGRTKRELARMVEEIAGELHAHRASVQPVLKARLRTV